LLTEGEQIGLSDHAYEAFVAEPGNAVQEAI
jgi:hypothetical protein